MERQKVFWVVLSVSVFVVVVLVVGAFLLRPRPAVASTPGAVSPLSDPGTQVYEYQSEAPVAPGTSSGGTETLHFYIGEGQGTEGATQTDQGAAQSLPGALPSPTPTAPQAATPTPSTAAPAPSRTVTVPPQKTTTSKPVAVAKAAPHGTQYWIQTGSYRSQTKAEDLAALLGDKGLSGRVFSLDSESGTWYRVRVGPYTSKGEAVKFLAEVRKLQGLGASYVAQVGPAKPVN